MFARLLVVLVLAIGLLAGPAWTRESCLAELKVQACECCPMPGESCCMRESEAPGRSTPPQAAPATPDLRDMLTPVLVFLGAPPETGAAGYGEGATSRSVPDSVAVIDRICIRLI